MYANEKIIEANLTMLLSLKNKNKMPNEMMLLSTYLKVVLAVTLKTSRLGLSMYK
jgi:hypothetical protein